MAGALASCVAVFGVLALRLHDGDDPSVRSSATVSRTTTTASRASDDSASSDAAGAVSSTPAAGTSAS
jgi:hypothetical protein